MDLQLQGKRALVTGSSSGIGQGIAKILAKEGAAVVVHGRDKGRCQAVMDEIVRAGGRAVVVVGELGTDQGADAVAKAALDQLGGIDILVNNAGGYDVSDKPVDWFDVTSASWLATFQQNTLSAFRLVTALVPAMRERKWGRVVSITTGGAMEPPPNMPDYVASKAALQNMSMSLAKTLTRTGVTVNTISPGVIRTARFENWVTGIGNQMGWEGDLDAVEARFITEFFNNTVGHAGRVEDIGNAVAFLVSPLARFITGANLRVDGGQLQSMN